MTLTPNQFEQSVVAGMVDTAMSAAGNTIPCAVKGDESTPLVSGQSVKLVDNNAGLPQITARAANTDPIFGIVGYTTKSQSFAATERVEVFIKDTVVYLTAGAAIARGEQVEINYDDNKVITNAGVNPAVGFAMDKAAADDDLIRVYLFCPVVNYNLDQLADVNLTSPTDEEVLEYDTVTATWVNGTDDTA